MLVQRFDGRIVARSWIIQFTQEELDRAVEYFKIDNPNSEFIIGEPSVRENDEPDRICLMVDRVLQITHESALPPLDRMVTETKSEGPLDDVVL